MRNKGAFHRAVKGSAAPSPVDAVMAVVRQVTEDAGHPLGPESLSRIRRDILAPRRGDLLSGQTGHISSGLFNFMDLIVARTREVKSKSLLCRLFPDGTVASVLDTQWHSMNMMLIDHPGEVIFPNEILSVVSCRVLGIPEALCRGTWGHGLGILGDVCVTVSRSAIGRVWTPCGVISRSITGDNPVQDIENALHKGPGPVLSFFGIDVPSRDLSSLSAYLKIPEVAQQVALKVLSSRDIER